MSYSRPIESHAYGFKKPSILTGAIYLSFFYGVSLLILGTLNLHFGVADSEITFDSEN